MCRKATDHWTSLPKPYKLSLPLKTGEKTYSNSIKPYEPYPKQGISSYSCTYMCRWQYVY